MLDDRDFDELMKPLVEMYSNMECELLKMIAERFKTYSDVSGSLEWYVKKLDELGGLNQAAIKLIAKYSKKSEQQIKEMLENAGYKSVPMDELQRIYEQGGTSINPKTISISRLLENSFVETKEMFKLIQTKALEGSKKAYMDVLNQAYLEVGGGYYDYNTSIKNACKKMAEQGITCATYKRKDGKIVNMSIESVVRRDTLTAINSMANKANDQYAQELQAKHVYVSEHLGARNVGTGWKNHESWQGQVYLINGSNEQYKNFKDTTGYGKVDGLGGVNCKHKHWAFFPGFSIEPKKLVNDEENSRIYELSQEQRYYERMIRKWKKKQSVYEGFGDNEGALKCKNKVKEWQNKLQEFIDKNPEMKRDYARERVYANKNIKEPKERKEEWIKKDEELLENYPELESDGLDIMKFNSKPTIKANSDEVVEFYLNKMNLKTTNEEVIRIVKENMQIMPVRDLKILDDFDVDLDITDKNSRYHGPKTLGKILGDKRTIYINPQKYQKGMFAHEFAHFAAHVNSLYNDKEFLQVVQNTIDNLTGLGIGKVDGVEYVFALSDSFITKYQGRTYIKKDNFNGNIKPKELREYISVGYQTFVTNPSLLVTKDKRLYDYFVKRGLRK